MVAPVTFSGSKMLILLGDGASPEVFSAPCGLTDKGLNRSAETNDTTVPDCDEPDAAVWTESEVVALSWEVSGSGKLTVSSSAVWDAWFESGAAKNVRIEVYSGANAGRKYSGAAVLTGCNLSGARGDKVTIEATIKGTGALTSADIT